MSVLTSFAAFPKFPSRCDVCRVRYGKEKAAYNYLLAETSPFPINVYRENGNSDTKFFMRLLCSGNRESVTFCFIARILMLIRSNMEERFFNVDQFSSGIPKSSAV